MKLPHVMGALPVLALVFAGCKAKGPQGWGVRCIEWSQSQPGAKPLPGVDQASVCLGECSGGPAFALWTDISGSSTGSSWDKARQAAHYESVATTADGRRVEMHCYLKDRRTGEVWIDGQTFRVEDGSLFLVSTASPKTVVRQVRRDVSALAADSASLREQAQRDPEIQQFFQRPSAAQ